MPARWPSALPQYADRRGLQIGIGETRLVSSTDVGGDESRRRTSRRADPHSVPMWFSDRQRLQFWSFWEGPAGGGNLPFWFPSIPPVMELSDDSDRLLTDAAGVVLVAQDWWLMRFAKRQPPPTFAPRGLEWFATLQLERII